MEEIELSGILKKDETQQGLIASFCESLKTLFSLFKAGKDADTAVIEQGQGEVEIETYKEICNDIHSYHQNLRELQEAKQKDSELTDSKWLEAKLEESCEDVVKISEGRGMTEEEKRMLKAEHNKALDDAIDFEANLLGKESEIESNALSNVKEENL